MSGQCGVAQFLFVILCTQLTTSSEQSHFSQQYMKLGRNARNFVQWREGDDGCRADLNQRFESGISVQNIGFTIALGDNSTTY